MLLQALPCGWIKVNTHGEVNSARGPGGCGGIFRINWEFVKGCFTASMSSMFAFEAELQAILFLNDYIKKFGWNYIWFEYDSVYVVNILEKQYLDVPWRFYAHWLNCVNFLSTISSSLACSFHLPTYCNGLHGEDVLGSFFLFNLGLGLFKGYGGA